MNKKEKIIKLYDKGINKEDISHLTDCYQKYVNKILLEYQKNKRPQKKIWIFLKRYLNYILTAIVLIEFILIFFPQVPHDFVENIGFGEKEIANISIIYNLEECEDEIVKNLGGRECEKIDILIENDIKSTVSIQNFRLHWVVKDWPKASIIVANKISSTGGFRVILPKIAGVINPSESARQIVDADPFSKDLFSRLNNPNFIAYISEYPAIRVGSDSLAPGDYLRFEIYVIPGVDNLSPIFIPQKELSKSPDRYALGYSYEFKEDTFIKKIEEGGKLTVGQDKITVKDAEFYTELIANW